MSLEALFGAPPRPRAAQPGRGQAAAAPAASGLPGEDQLAQIAALLAAADRPVLVLGSDVWIDGAETAARAAAEELGSPSSPTARAAASCPRAMTC